MGLFGFGGISHKNEERAIKEAMESVGAYESNGSDRCERCKHWLSSSQTGSKYFGGCSGHGIKVFASWVCGHFQR